MKICFVANAESVHTERWVGYFVAAGHEVHLISHEGREIKGAKFHKLKTFGKAKITTEKIRLVDMLTYAVRAFQTRRLIRKIKPEIVHAHNVILGGFYSSVSKFHPVVVTAWGTDVLIAPNVSIILRKIAKYVLKNADLITCDGNNTREAMLSLGADPGKINIIFFGIDTSKNSPQKKNEDLRVKLNCGNCPLIISLRSFNPVYSIETLIKAIPLVLAEIPDAKFIIAGTGPQKEYLKNLSLTLGLENNIIFTGNLATDEIPAYLASSDLYVSTSLSDSGLAASTGEAMACGLPVISTDVGSIRDWINEGDGGFIIPKENHGVLAEKIILLIKDRSLMKKFGEINRNTIVERQDYYTEMKKMENIYNSMCNSDNS